MSLFKIFIENEVSLHNLGIDIFTTSDQVDYLVSLIATVVVNMHQLNVIINLHQNLKKILLDNKSFLSYQSLFLSKIIIVQIL
ncbi:hypothetical protein GLOIN_2v1871581 [Rhizophagus irregularis DAOM 181602=DAOM 197198]|nr:hypothetical protein GLOIN_2v1871581 [Rhizophagus irregularis DAOM 181602=DAOM 197198]